MYIVDIPVYVQKFQENDVEWLHLLLAWTT